MNEGGYGEYGGIVSGGGGLESRRWGKRRQGREAGARREARAAAVEAAGEETAAVAAVRGRARWQQGRRLRNVQRR